MEKDSFIPKNWAKRGNLITVIGVGGGGSNAVSYMFSQGIKDVDFIVCNTDCQALESSPVPKKLQLGVLTTKGLGAGTDYLVGRKAAQESIEDIEKIFNPDTEMAFVTCGMGGGTGTGAAPVVAKVAKEKGLLTVGVVTIPFRDEGIEALYRATEGIKELSKFVDSLLVIDNQKLYSLYSDLDAFSAFPKADDVLATAVKSIAEIITSRGFINVDFADVKKIMQNSGMAIMGIGSASGEDRATKAVEAAFNSPLLNDLNLSNVKNALVNITSSSEPGKAAKMSEVSTIMDYVKTYTGEMANFKRGIVKNDALGDSVSVTIVATGFNLTELPVIDQESVSRGNRIEIRSSDTFKNRRRGLPLQSNGELTLTKARVPGIPVMLTADPETLSTLEKEPAYVRRDRMLNTPKETE
ncbi:MAG: cell division protein FtsZ [Bacteroidales bacterium]|nr:cell division protein FtsZ [Candidatus Cacconaster merdequi]